MNPNNLPSSNEEQKKQRAARRKWRLLLLLVINTLLFFTVYRVLLFYAEMTDNTFGSFLVMILYLALLLGLVLGYLVYNRFLYRKGLTLDQLPLTWSEAQKQEFLADAERRLERSKWMMTLC